MIFNFIITGRCSVLFFHPFKECRFINQHTAPTAFDNLIKAVGFGVEDQMA